MKQAYVRNEGAPGIRVACVGLGWVTLNRHLPAMRRIPGVQIAGVVDRDPDLAKRVALRLGVTRYSGEEELSRVPFLDDIDVVTIGTSPMTHYRLVRAALEAGKHVITEKPFALTVEEGVELAQLARERARVLAVVHNFQFARSTQLLLRDISSGRLGTVRGICALQFSNPRRRLPVWREDLPLGLFYDESPHFFYLLRRLAPGPLALMNCSVVRSRRARRTPALVQAVYRAPREADDEVGISMTLNFEAPVSEWHIVVLGEEYLGDVDIFRDIYIRLPNDGKHTSWPVLRTTTQAIWGHLSQHLVSGLGHLSGRLLYGNVEVFGRFFDAVRGTRKLEYITPEDAIAVLKLQHEIVRSSVEGQAGDV